MAVQIGDPVAVAASLGPLIRAHVAETEANRRLAGPVVEALRDSGLLALNRPVAFGGAEADPLTMAVTKTPNYGGALARRGSAQRQVAEAEARLGAGRAFLFEVYSDAYAAALAGEPITLAHKQRMQLSGTHAANEAAAAVGLVCAAAGSSAARVEYRFERLWRDVQTMITQAFSSPGRYESVGQLMLGVPTDWPFLDR